jgi:hypothetical protein
LSQFAFALTAQHTLAYSAVLVAGLSELRLAYKKAVDEWVAAIRAEEALATPDHSMTAMGKWDAAHFREQDTQTKATEAREAYLDALRKVSYGMFALERGTSFRCANYPVGQFWR